jgi:DNA-binding response OmpR family regulator
MEQEMKILVIEDDNVTRMLMSRVLQKRFSCTVLEASNGLDGLLMIGKEKPDLVLLDLMMPVMDGKETLEAIRADAGNRNLPVIIASDVRDKHLVSKLLGLGISDFLAKPINPDEAQNTIARVLSNAGRTLSQDVQSALPQHTRKRLLVVDKDNKFRRLVKSVLGEEFEVLEAESGAEGLQVALDRNPDIVCLGEGLSLLNEKLLAKRLSSAPWDRHSCVYLLSEKGDVKNSESWLFHGVCKKSYAPEVFLENFKGVAGVKSSHLGVMPKKLL